MEFSSTSVVGYSRQLYFVPGREMLPFVLPSLVLVVAF